MNWAIKKMILYSMCQQLVLCFLTSCTIDQVDKYYSNYTDIVVDNYDKKGWIPQSIILESTTDLYSRTNVDVNSFLIRFSVNKHDLHKILIQIDEKHINFKKPHGVGMPDWWNLNPDTLTTYKYKKDTSVWNFAIDDSNMIIYCWGTHK